MNKSLLSVTLSLFTATMLLPAMAQPVDGDPLTAAAVKISEQFAQSTTAKRGEVAAVEQGPPIELYVTLGSDDNIVEGQFLSIVSKGEPIVVNGQTVGYKESPIGIAEVTRVQNEKLCSAAMRSTEKGKQPTVGCAAYARTVPSSLALTSFERSDRQVSALGQEFADKLMLSLQQTGRFRLQERTRFEAVLAEMSLGLNDLFNPEKAIPLGQQLQAKGIVVGTISRRDDRYETQARVIDVETGIIVATATATFGRSGYCDERYDTIVAAGTATGATPGTTPTTGRGSVRLFDALEPIDGKEPVALPLGTVSVGGKLYDDCVGYRPFHVVYDLKGTNWTELRARVGLHDRDRQWQWGGVAIYGDGQCLYGSLINTNKPISITNPDIRVPLEGIRQLSVYGPREEGDGIVAIEDFTLIGADG